ncbi:hypothetical protein FOXG_21360 [Fusarium oxysporum f. sp. lycopersici 4287]|uniref:Uncharacterized protein n=1 Tax=Fusarium oxysporum f. sp. lycopersici (strain 4287 / CBS 123668 / FGSC 9935 / NRRL 34936) TaxID=426428 RepID=A0A0J9WS85_FUSO4|nr:hypothetical protein FOXG_20947 [Fusarium oxysporum f. sp. lycopersici 4287]XP_018253563.1 hypothetical protein FOXG_21360 [Fusarium oxysporum f. sp. lycopersici 4287]EWZ78190.1 hypothetical protein FOWG_17492 [Fusarium oxysporum f. sp. lycopersici MN25]KNB13842.1 hypothetical protein FOXG_20947 [Fusarium oxysporum f. sp. lycopersici 4287]KNB15518.1 hypothetical protein FOXG_21360 [Fusarium oxysporum f. sp. lycopersici 4287]
MALTTGSYEFDHAQIPGLWQPLKEEHFAQTCEDHNKLPTDDALPEVEEKVKEHLPQLEALFKRWKVEGFFALSVLHRHFKLPDGYNQVGRTIKKRFYFTRKVANNALNSSKVYGSKFVLTPRGWSPVEIHEGSMPGLSRVDPEFLSCFTTHLVNHDLTSIFGFEYIVRELSTFNTLELDLPGYGLIVVSAASVPSIDAPTVTTRWIWSHQTELKCIPSPDGHVRKPVKPQQSDPSDDQVIAAFEKEYHDAY